MMIKSQIKENKHTGHCFKYKDAKILTQMFTCLGNKKIKITSSGIVKIY